MIHKFLNAVRASKAKYLMVGSYLLNTRGNYEIRIGDYFEINLLMPPFNLPSPLEIFRELNAGVHKFMLVFDVKTLPALRVPQSSPEVTGQAQTYNTPNRITMAGSPLPRLGGAPSSPSRPPPKRVRIPTYATHIHIPLVHLLTHYFE